MKYTFFLDAGHGGIVDDNYVTPGKRSPVWNDGSQLFEGEFNRDIVRRIFDLHSDTAQDPDFPSLDLTMFDIIANLVLKDYEGISNPQNHIAYQYDWSLKSRVDFANRIASVTSGTCIYLSIHANGFTNESAHGWEVFTSPGETKADAMATRFYKRIEEKIPETVFRTDTSDGDLDKEASFYVLKKTIMPAILTENYFMTNEEECKNILMNGHKRQMIAEAHYAAMRDIVERRL